MISRRKFLQALGGAVLGLGVAGGSIYRLSPPKAPVVPPETLEGILGDGVYRVYNSMYHTYEYVARAECMTTGRQFMARCSVDKFMADQTEPEVLRKMVTEPLAYHLDSFAADHGVQEYHMVPPRLLSV